MKSAEKIHREIVSECNKLYDKRPKIYAKARQYGLNNDQAEELQELSTAWGISILEKIETIPLDKLSQHLAEIESRMSSAIANLERSLSI